MTLESSDHPRQSPTEEYTQMADRRWPIRIPIWVRVPGIIALALVGMVISPVLLDAAGVAGGHGSGDEMEVDDGGHGSGDVGETGGDDHGSGGGGGHGSGDGGDHGSGQLAGATEDRQRHPRSNVARAHATSSTTPERYVTTQRAGGSSLLRTT